MMSTPRGRWLSDMREIRNALEKPYDDLRDMNLYSFPKLNDALEAMKQALDIIQAEIEENEDHTLSSWPKKEF